MNMLATFNDIFSDAFETPYFMRTYSNRQTRTAMYRVDENGDLNYEFVLPGYEKNEVEIITDVSKNGNRLIRVKAKNTKNEYDASFSVYDGFDVESAVAKLKNGILTVTFKKVEKESTIKIIKIDD